MNAININKKISYIPASSDPLSADIGIIREGDGIWLFDVGAQGRVIDELKGNYSVVLSHFHQDHTTNINKINAEKIYASPETIRHIKTGLTVREDVYIGNLHIFPLPSSHCKGCIGLEVDGVFAFVGDALYSKVRDGYYVYNAQLVREEIRVLKSLKAPNLLVSHFPGLIRSRETAIQELEEIYSLRKKDDPEIIVSR